MGEPVVVHRWDAGLSDWSVRRVHAGDERVRRRRHLDVQRERHVGDGGRLRRGGDPGERDPDLLERDVRLGL
jgi:hypothetical protein